MGLQAWLARNAGDLWKSWGAIALWPYPAVVWRYPKYRFEPRDYRCFTKHLKAGDFILTRSNPYFISNRAIKGTAFKHLAVFCGAVSGHHDAKTGFLQRPKTLGLNHKHTGMCGRDVYERAVVHAISEGVVCQDLIEVLFHCDYAIAVRPWIDEDQQGAILDAALGKVGADYDFGFKTTPEDLYCTELGAYCCEKSGIASPEKVKIVNSLAGLVLPLERFKAPVTLADHFLKFPAVCASRTCDEVGFQRKSRFRELLRAQLYKLTD